MQKYDLRENRRNQSWQNVVAFQAEALRKMEAETQAVMSKLTGGLGGGFPF